MDVEVGRPLPPWTPGGRARQSVHASPDALALRLTRPEQANAPRAVVLLIEPDAETAEWLTAGLETRGYRVQRAATAEEGKALRATTEVDLVLLDLILPDADGLVLLGDLKVGSDPPVVVLSRTQRRGDAVLCLRLGADDFVSGDVPIGEIEARIDAVLRRTRAAWGHSDRGIPERLQFDGLEIDVPAGRVRFDGMPVELTPIEFRLLVALVRSDDHIISRKELVEGLWGDRSSPQSRAVDVHVGRLRKKLRARGYGPTIVALRLQAFRLLAPGAGGFGAG